jgi:hypothetical protein
MEFSASLGGNGRFGQLHMVLDLTDGASYMTSASEVSHPKI